MAIKAKVLVIGGKTFVSEPEPKKEPKKPPQALTKVSEPVKKIEPPRVEHESPQDMVEIVGEPRRIETHNSFILKHTSKFYRDMIDE